MTGLKFVLLSIEFDAGTFSGNGVYACSQARALAQLGHQVLVVAGAPPGHGDCVSTGLESKAGGQRVVHVALPVWGCLDAGCAWREFAAGAAEAGVASEVAAFGAHAVLGVDWHSVGAFEALQAALPPATLPPFVYLNYRVYHRTASPADLAVIEEREAAALRRAAASLALSRADADYLRRHFPAAAAAPLHVLLPALRADVAALPPPSPLFEEANGVGGGAAAASAVAWAAGRRHLTCCVRLSPEKEAHRFVELLEELQARGALARLGVVPAMCGAGWGSDYGGGLRRRLEQRVPQCIIHESFMGPADLARLFAATLLNLHPPTYDAYGMTVVEAASQGAPSLVQGGGGVGATDLLSGEGGEVLLCDMDRPAAALADEVERLLGDTARLAAVGRAAARKARSWTERDNAAALVQHVQHALRRGAAGTLEPASGAQDACRPEDGAAHLPA